MTDPLPTIRRVLNRLPHENFCPAFDLLRAPNRGDDVCTCSRRDSLAACDALEAEREKLEAERDGARLALESNAPLILDLERKVLALEAERLTPEEANEILYLAAVLSDGLVSKLRRRAGD